ncbi:hypothetical protein ABGB18_46475 [Nonomuraea sp. B12E4]|uniref:alpha/beta fold hydrolase n=1 Tax=Nonomuraea sp. B12E4 TaxID=3153564 RepID=UPI00325F2A5F
MNTPPDSAPDPVSGRGGGPVPDGFEHTAVTANGITLHAVVGGSGAPVLLPHGRPQTWRAWRHVLPILAEHGYRVIGAPSRTGTVDADLGAVAAVPTGALRRAGPRSHRVAGPGPRDLHPRLRRPDLPRGPHGHRLLSLRRLMGAFR